MNYLLRDVGLACMGENDLAELEYLDVTLSMTQHIEFNVIHPHILNATFSTSIFNIVKLI